ncbi:uncharacterized protein ISCGN_006095 [Ixodes scapularis]
MTPNIPLLFTVQFLIVTTDSGFATYHSTTTITPAASAGAVLLRFFPITLGEDDRGAGATLQFPPAALTYTQVPPTSTSCARPSKAFTRDFSTSGHGEQAPMMTPNIPLLFTVQFLIVTTDSGFATYHSTTTITPAASAGAVLLRFLPITLGEDDRGAGATLQFPPAALTYTQVPPTSTSCARPSKAFTRDFSTSGHGEQAPMMTPNIPLLFTVQFLIVTTDSGFATYHSTTTITPAASAGAVLLRFLPITLGEDDRGAGATLQFPPAALTYTQVPPTSTSCARPSKAFTRDFSTSGHGEQAPMMTPNIPLLFTVQFLIVTTDSGFATYHSTTTITPAASAGAVLLRFLPITLGEDDRGAGATLQFPPAALTYTQVPPTSTSCARPSKAFTRDFSTSGHGEQAPMMTPNIPLLFTVQFLIVTTDSGFATYHSTTTITPAASAGAVLLRFLPITLGEDDRGAGATLQFPPAALTYTQVPPTSTSCARPSKAFTRDFSTSGHGEQAPMMTPNIPLLFTVQFLIVTTDSGFATYHSTTTITPAASAGAVLLRFLPITLGEDDRGAGATLQFPLAALTYTQVPPTSTSCARPSKAFTRDFSTSGHGEQAPMMTPNIPLLFTVQVGVHEIPYSIRSNNVCLVVLPCPRTCLKRFRDLLLLLSGDVERNPGPMSKPEAESLANIESIVSQLHAGQSSIMSQLKELNDEQKRTNNSISALTARVGIIESDLAICKSKMNSAEELEQKLESVLLEMASLKRRSDDAESRSRRSNLIFFGFKDTTKETWAESEKTGIGFVLR